MGRNLAGAAWEAGYPRVDAAAGVIKTLAGAGFTGRRLDPSEERLLLDVGCGITNLVARGARYRRVPERIRLPPRQYWRAAGTAGVHRRVGAAEPQWMNANYQLPDLIRLFAELRAVATAP